VANKINLTISVNDDGSLKIVAADAKKAASALNQTAAATSNISTSTKEASKSRNAYNKLEKGTAQLTNNSTKAFSKQAQTLGGVLVPAYATLAANIFALTAAFGALRRAAAAEQLIQGLVQVGAAAGQNLPKVAANLREITGAAVSTQAAMSAVALGTSAGFSSKQLEDLTKVAKGASLALGRDMEDALTRLVKGTAKLEPEILDELGILVRLDTAAAKYAATLGKSVTQLTQFERRQAFLNETITQGLDKFGEISDNIDPNKYDQLGAAFDDMSKKIFNGLDRFLGPIASFLADSMPAMTGAMLLFGSTIISKIVPALGAMAEAQRDVAVESAMEAKKLGASARGEYQKAVQGIGGFGIAPKSIKETEELYKAGSVSVKQLTADVKILENSEISRSNWIKKWEVEESTLRQANKNANNEELKANWAEIKALQEKIKLKKEELALITASKQQRIDAIAIGGNVGQVGKAELTALSKASMDIRQADALVALQNKGLIATLKITGQAIKGHAADVSLAAGRTVAFSIAMRAAALSTQLLGRALLSLIPVIGQVLLVVSVLWPMLSNLWAKGAVAKETKEVIKGFNSLNDIGRSLNITLESNKSNAEKFIAALSVQVGILDQLASGLQSIQNAKNAETEDNLTGKIQKRIDLEKTAALFTEQAVKDQYTNRIKNIQAEIDAIVAGGTIVDQVSAERVILSMQQQILAQGPTVSSSLKETTDNLGKLLYEVKSGTYSVEGGMVQLSNRITQLQSPIASVVEAVKNSQDVISSLNKEITKLKTKNSTPYDDLVENFESVNAQMLDSMGKGALGLEAFLEKNEDFARRLFEIYSGSNKGGLMEAVKSFFTFNPAELMKDLTTQLRESRNIILTTSAAVKELETRFKDIKEVSSFNPEAMSESLNLERQILETKIKGLQEEIKIRKLFGAELLDKQAEINALAKGLELNKATYDIEVKIAGIKQKQKLFGYAEIELRATQEILKANQTIASIKLRTSSASANQDISVLDDYRLFKEQESERKKNLLDAYALKVQGIALEYQLLEAQTALEKAKLESAGIQSAIFDTYIGLLSTARNSAIAAAGATFTADTAGIGGESSDKQRAVLQQSIAQANERATISVERYRNAGYEVGAIELEIKNNKSEQLRLQREWMDAALEGLDTSAKELEIEQLRTKEQSLQIAKLQEFARVAGTIGGAGAGVAAGFAAELAKIAPILESTEASLSEKMFLMAESMNPFIDQLKALGPDGEVMSTVFEGTFAMTQAFTKAFEEIGNGGLTMQTGLLAAASTVNALSNIQAAQSRAAIAGIDSQIAAEKARDGQSAASVAKIAALEKKQESLKRKAFEQNKKMQMAQTVINTASAVMMTMSSVPAPFNFALAGLVAAMGAAQLAIIASSSFQGGASAGNAGQPSAVTVGERNSVVDLARARNPAGEIAYTRGEMGTGNGAGSYVPAAFTGRNVGANTGIRVGEQGAEIFVPKVPGRIIPADDAEKVGGTSNVTFQINAIDAKGVEEVLLQQRGNIINMLRQAANDRGEFFMENVA